MFGSNARQIFKSSFYFAFGKVFLANIALEVSLYACNQLVLFVNCFRCRNQFTVVVIAKFAVTFTANFTDCLCLAGSVAAEAVNLGIGVSTTLYGTLMEVFVVFGCPNVRHNVVACCVAFIPLVGCIFIILCAFPAKRAIVPIGVALLAVSCCCSDGIIHILVIIVTGCADDPAVFCDFSSSLCIGEELAALASPISGIARSLAGSSVGSVSGEVGVLASGFFAAICGGVNNFDSGDFYLTVCF